MIIDRLPADLRTDCSTIGVRTERVPADLRTDVSSTSQRVYGKVGRIDNSAWRRRMLFVDLEHAREPQDLIIQSIPAIHVDKPEELGVRDPGCERTDIDYRDLIAGGGLFQ